MTSARLREIADFLSGKAPLEGVWFGEDHPTKKGKFWWRSEYLPELRQLADRIDSLTDERIEEEMLNKPSKYSDPDSIRLELGGRLQGIKFAREFITKT